MFRFLDALFDESFTLASSLVVLVRIGKLWRLPAF